MAPTIPRRRVLYRRISGLIANRTTVAGVRYALRAMVPTRAVAIGQTPSSSTSRRWPRRRPNRGARWCSRQQAVEPTLARRTRPRDAKGRRSAFEPALGAHTGAWVADRCRSPRPATLGCATDGVANFDSYRRSGRRVRIVDESPLSIGRSPACAGCRQGRSACSSTGALLEPCHIAHGPFGCARSSRVSRGGETWLIGRSPLYSNGP